MSLAPWAVIALLGGGTNGLATELSANGATPTHNFKDAHTSAIDVRHYRLELAVDPASRSLQGRVTIRARVEAPTSELAQALTVDRVELDGRPAQATSGSMALRGRPIQ